MPVEKSKLENILQEQFPEAEIIVTALVDDNDHYSIVIKDSVFNGKNRVEQQRIVNKALGDLLQKELHAMQLKTIGV
ncbi:MAG: BolA/IbaG family iron-sulfur metabolism protein [Rickettsiales bacterium]|nr:BolA/IbaG family iron-sulfur metabolism protein [Rickettsiales bacterium]